MDQIRARELEKKLDLYLRPLIPLMNKEIILFNQELRIIYDNHFQTITDCLQVVKVYFSGFDAISQGKIKEESSDLYNWVKKIKRERSSRIIANLIATQIVSSLEYAIIQFTEYGIKNSIDFNNKYLPLNEKYNNIELRLKPSGNKKFHWPNSLLELYDIKLESFIIEILTDLVSVRNEASHTNIHVQKSIKGESLKNWSFGVIFLIHLLAKSINNSTKNT